VLKFQVIVQKIANSCSPFSEEPLPETYKSQQNKQYNCTVRDDRWWPISSMQSVVLSVCQIPLLNTCLKTQQKLHHSTK